MSTNSFSDRYLKPAGYTLGVIAWVFICVFVLPAILLGSVISLMVSSGADMSFLVESAAGTLSLYGLSFALGFCLMMILPVWLQKLKRIELKKLLGVTRGIKPIDIGYGLMAFGAYMVMTVMLQIVAIQLLPGYNPEEVQQLGFSVDAVGLDIILAGLGLVVLAPVFEELIFRGYVFSEIRKKAPFWLTGLIVSLFFAAMHLSVNMSLEGPTIEGINVALDVFVLSLCMCVVREKTESVWGTILMHMIKNGLAFTLLFIVKIG